LNEETKPGWSADVSVVEIFTGRGKEVIPKRTHHGAPEQGIQHQSAQDGVAQDFNRVFVEGRRNLNTRWRVVYLMKDKPETFAVTDAMPPIEEKRADNPTDESF
jgi:hypothetical protein